MSYILHSAIRLLENSAAAITEQAVADSTGYPLCRPWAWPGVIHRGTPPGFNVRLDKVAPHQNMNFSPNCTWRSLVDTLACVDVTTFCVI